jgi:hypothetical protein
LHAESALITNNVRMILYIVKFYNDLVTSDLTFSID